MNNDWNEELDELMAAVCMTLIGLEITRSGCSSAECVAAGQRVAIRLLDAGSITLQCSPELAALAARELFGEEAGQSPDDAREAVAELLNVVAGNLRGLVGAHSIDLPSPVSPDADLGACAHYDSGAGSLHVALDLAGTPPTGEEPT